MNPDVVSPPRPSGTQPIGEPRASEADRYAAVEHQSIWISIVTHTLPSFVMIGVILSLVL